MKSSPHAAFINKYWGLGLNHQKPDPTVVKRREFIGLVRDPETAALRRVRFKTTSTCPNLMDHDGYHLRFFVQPEDTDRQDYLEMNSDGVWRWWQMIGRQGVELRYRPTTLAMFPADGISYAAHVMKHRSSCMIGNNLIARLLLGGISPEEMIEMRVHCPDCNDCERVFACLRDYPGPSFTPAFAIVDAFDD